MNFEKPYAQTLEGVSRVMKETPPCLGHPKQITRGYPAITATIVNLDQPATTYANWFSYTRPEFIRLNREIEKALRVTRTLFSGQTLRFIGDAGLDGQKIFDHVARVRGEFVIRACHDRDIEVYNPRRQPSEREKLFDLVATLPFEFEQKVRLHPCPQASAHAAALCFCVIGRPIRLLHRKDLDPVCGRVVTPARRHTRFEK